MNDSRAVTCCSLHRCMNTQSLKKCASCGTVSYCCKEHQSEHFKEGGHKFVCPGRSVDKGPPLTFAECLEKASKFYSQKMWLAALPYYGAMLELTQRQLGIFHSQNAKLLDVIATCYRQQNKFDCAVQCLQRCVIIRELENDGSKEKNQESINLLGRISEYCIHGGQYELAKNVLKKLEESVIVVFGEQSLDRAKVLNSLAVCLEQEGKLDEAEEVLTAAVSLQGCSDSVSTDDLLISSNFVCNLGVLLMKRDKPAEAIPRFEEALSRKQRGQLPADHPDIVSLHGQIAESIQRANVIA